jgi:hypothetical protein
MELFAPLGELDGDVWLSEATMVSSGVEQAVFPHPIDGECAELLVCRVRLCLALDENVQEAGPELSRKILWG